MELLGVISALECLKEPCEVEVITDAKYVVQGISENWAVKWRANNWMRKNKKPALNHDLWERLLDIIEKHSVTFSWIKGHSGHEYNERCDKIASKTAHEFKAKIIIS
jgi:ribonuclease HI